MTDPKIAIASLNHSGKRARVNDAQVVLKVPARAKELVEELAAADEVSSAVIWRHALADYLAKRGITQ